MSVIEIENLTKDYGRGRGIFGVNLTINQGEMVGFVGTNGSGKTTTIRNILGYVKPTSGSVKVNGLSSWENSSEIAKMLHTSVNTVKSRLRRGREKLAAIMKN